MSARWAVALAAALLSGCSTLLPREQSEVASPWHSFDEARSAIESITPHVTSAAELRNRGLDPYASPNVQLLTFSDIVLRFPLGAGLDSARMDPGLQECFTAGRECRGYSMSVKEIHKDRTGNYLQDAFGFKRVTHVTGWTFNALILLVGDRVVYTLYGGQPQVREQEVTRQPLGPLQEWGDNIPLR